MIGITNGFIKVEKEVVETESSKVEGGSTNGEDAPTRSLESGGGGMVAVALDSSDELYRLIRAQNIEQLGPFLQAKVIIIIYLPLFYVSLQHLARNHSCCAATVCQFVCLFV